MIHFSEIAARRRRYSALLAPITGACGLLLYLASAYLPIYGAWQLIAIVFLGVAILLFARHSIEYSYFIQTSPDDGLLEFGVKERRGRRVNTICRLLLSDLREIEICSAERKKKCRSRFAGDTVHSYCPDIFPRETVYLLFEEDGSRIVLCLQPSEELLTLLEQHLPQ